MLSQNVIDSLFPPDLPEPAHWEQRYPPRDLPEGAAVTRFAPSPTGFLHIGGVYTAMINADLAKNSGGIYLVRIEDTDQARTVEEAAAQFAAGFAYFDISPTEDDLTGKYGPYTQSARQPIYLTYVRELLRQERRTCVSPARKTSPLMSRGRRRRARCPATTAPGRSGAMPRPSRWRRSWRRGRSTWSGSGRRDWPGCG
jgi:tRNA synthetases class I (E and Q), catalytic domain